MTNRTDEKTEMHALALRVCQRIEAEAAAITLLDGHDGTWWGDTDIDDREPIRAARETLELPAFVPNVDAATDVCDGLEDARDAIRFDGPLSIEATGTNDGRNGWQVDGCTIVLGTGGPHVQVEWSFNAARVVAYGWFGADRVELPVDMDAVESLYGVSDWLDSLEG